MILCRECLMFSNRRALMHQRHETATSAVIIITRRKERRDVNISCRGAVILRGLKSDFYSPNSREFGYRGVARAKMPW